MIIEDIRTWKSNCEEYARSSKKSVEVLRNANGKNHYKEIAKIVGIHPTRVSGLLKKAASIGLTTKVRPGIYKKKPGALSYMPPKNIVIKTATKTVSDILHRISKSGKSKRIANFLGLTVPNRILISMDKMVNAYMNLYVVENTLRELIRKVFGKKVDWWEKNVPSGIQDDVKNAIKRAPYHAATRNDRLEYTNLGQLKEIIIYKKNWNDFLVHLNTKDKSDFSATINKAIPSRNAVGHCIPLQTKDLKVIDVRFEDILKMIKK